MFFFFLSCMFVTCPSLDLCGTEQQLMLARFVLYLESGHPDESIYLSCAWAFDFLTLRRAHSFCSSVHSLWPSLLSVSAKFKGKPSNNQLSLHLFLNDRRLCRVRSLKIRIAIADGENV